MGQYCTLKCEKKHHPTVRLIYCKHWIIEDNNDVISIQYSGPVVRMLSIDGLSYGKSCIYCIFSGLLVEEAKTSDDVS